MISAESITKQFDTVVAVDAVSFEVGKGEVVGLLGPNGAGKTTTMRLLTSYYAPDAGRILIDGVDTRDDDVKTRGMIGYLPEENPLYEDMLVEEYLRFVADVRRISGDDRKKMIKKAAAETGIKDVLNKPVGELSKGYRQRVGLAQAVLHQPKILVLDEPTEGLDPNQRVEIRNLIRNVGRKRTVLLSTHVLQEVQATCDRVLVINKGRLIADNTVEELQEQAGGGRRIVVELEGKYVRPSLQKLDGVKSVNKVGSHDGRARFELAVSGDADPRHEIFNLAKEKDWELWELHQESASLEDIFRTLTQADDLDEGPSGKAKVRKKSDSDQTEEEK